MSRTKTLITLAQETAPQQRLRIRRKLLHWYDRNKRDLPWRRREGDAYSQWIAEIMLQQTRVDTVIGYYERFLRRFPSIDALAAADFEQVLRYWAGLGYYRRIQNLHKAALQLANEGRGIPRSYDQLRELPGVGAYTAGAIASIAFQLPHAAVDGNVSRVVSRLMCIADPPASPRGRQRIDAAAGELLSKRRPGDFNQAWMDLGSLICTLREPNCRHCPLNQDCMAYRDGLVDRLPHRASTKRKNPVVEVVVGVFSGSQGWLLRRRSMDGLWPGLWEWPNESVEKATTATRLVERLAQSLNIVLIPGSPVHLGSIAHELTHRSYRFHVYAQNVGGVSMSPGDDATRWVSRSEMAKLPLSTAAKRIAALVSA